MSRLFLTARLLALGLVYTFAFPIQELAVRYRWRAAGIIPVVFHRTFLRLFGIRVSERGERPEGATLVLANHVSWLDIPVIGSLAPLSFIAKSEVAGWPIAGTFARLQRSVFLDRARRRDTANVNGTVAERLASGQIIVLFAEGTTGDGNRLLPFRSSLVGALEVAGNGSAGDSVRLQPLAIAYTRRNGLPLTRRERPLIAWYGDMELFPHLAALVREGVLDVVVTWGAPMAYAGDRKKAAAEAQASIRQALGPKDREKLLAVSVLTIPFFTISVLLRGLWS